MEALQRDILKKQQEIKELQDQLLALQNSRDSDCSSSTAPRSSLSHSEIARYSRQLILPELGVSGQLLLANASVLVVGCGGLGCPAAIYLAAAGIGTLGLLDYDDVEISNLHRQVLHTESRVNFPKADSVGTSVLSLNSHIKVKLHKVVISSTTALDIIKQYDVVLDCTDNVATRYLLNDACILSKKPLVSGAALRWEGQLTVYNHNSGPCYRCLFPEPPPPETVTNCSDGGVLGVVPGIIGSCQALEAIKIITSIGAPLSNSMLLFDAFSSSFRKVKLRSRQPKCVVCGDSPTVSSLIDYEQFCGAKAEDKDAGVNLLECNDRIHVKTYHEMIQNNHPHVLVDVRMPIELGICSLEKAVNVPLKEIDNVDNLELIKNTLKATNSAEIICLCRRGNDSQKAVLALKKSLSGCTVKDVIGGLTAWAKEIDPSMPLY